MTTRRLSSYAEELRKKYGRISFGRFLSAWRRSEDLSQAVFARKLGLSPANLCDLEQGRRIPSPRRAQKIARKLGLPEKGIIAMVLEDTLYKCGFRFAVEIKDAA